MHTDFGRSLVTTAALLFLPKNRKQKKGDKHQKMMTVGLMNMLAEFFIQVVILPPATHAITKLFVTSSVVQSPAVRFCFASVYSFKQENQHMLYSTAYVLDRLYEASVGAYIHVCVHKST